MQSRAGTHLHGLGSEPDGIDANHWARPRMKRAQPSGSEAGHFTVMDLSPRGSEMITISSVARLMVVVGVLYLSVLQQFDTSGMAEFCRC